MRFCTVNLGCKVNRVETDQAATVLLSQGFEESTEADADVIVVNTCTVTGEAEKKTRKAVRHALRSNAHAQVVVTGCASAIDPETYQAMDSRVVLVPKAGLLEHLQGLDSQHGMAAVPDIAQLRVGGAFRTRVGIKVQDGCNNACTYCIVHVARGRAHSRDMGLILDEVRQLTQAGVKEIVLTGINLGTFEAVADGKDVDLASLLSRMLDMTSDVSDGVPPRFRISSIEPKNVTDRLIEVMAASDGRICRHLHLPLQAGSSKVLREMARPYNAEFFCDLVTRMREAMPQLALSTDIIAGFPGETDAEFEETLEVARTCRFMKIHSFPYSLRAGTPAAKRTDQISPEAKAQRAGQLRELSDELAALDLSLRAGTTELGLVEPEGIVTLESYHTVDAPAGAAIGALIPVVL